MLPVEGRIEYNVNCIHFLLTSFLWFSNKSVNGKRDYLRNILSRSFIARICKMNTVPWIKVVREVMGVSVYVRRIKRLSPTDFV